MDDIDGWDRKAREALIRMSKNFKAGRGVRISWDELEVLERTFIGQTWADVEFDAEDTKPLPTQL